MKRVKMELLKSSKELNRQGPTGSTYFVCVEDDSAIFCKTKAPPFWTENIVFFLHPLNFIEIINYADTLLIMSKKRVKVNTEIKKDLVEIIQEEEGKGRKRGREKKDQKELTKKSKIQEEQDELNYSSKDYWNDRYCIPCDPKKPVESEILSHEWYYTFDELAPLITKLDLFKKRDDFGLMKILEIGCGNKPLIESFHNLKDESGKSYFLKDQLYGVDFSDNCIKLLNNAQKGNEKINYISMDARHLIYNDESFELIIDKGTMDAMLSEKQRKKGIENATQMISEMIRVLSSSCGTIMIISHIEYDSEEYELFVQDILSPLLLEEKRGVYWKLDIHSVERKAEEGEEDNEEKQYGTVYCITCYERKNTRSKYQIPNDIFVEIFEYSDDEGEDIDEGEDNEST